MGTIIYNKFQSETFKHKKAKWQTNVFRGQTDFESGSTASTSTRRGTKSEWARLTAGGAFTTFDRSGWRWATWWTSQTSQKQTQQEADCWRTTVSKIHESGEVQDVFVKLGSELALSDDHPYDANEPLKLSFYQITFDKLMQFPIIGRPSFRQVALIH